jgi:hypothetical protein
MVKPQFLDDDDPQISQMFEKLNRRKSAQSADELPSPLWIWRGVLQ